MDRYNIIALLLVIMLWYANTMCSERLTNYIPKKTIFILSSLIYAIIISIYIYCNIHECYEHYETIQDTNVITLLLVMALITCFSGFCTICISR
jgi:hypothetical protein